jgi:O-antigen/teichoic acid export membrane protein
VILFREAGARYRDAVLRADAAWSIIAFVIQVAAGGLVAVVIGRHLGPEAKGYASLISIGPTVAAWLAALGIGQATMFLAAGRRDPIDRLLTMSTATAPLLGGAAAVAGWLVLGPKTESPEVALALAVGFVFVCLQLLRDFHASALLGVKRVTTYAKATMYSRIISAGIVIAAVYLLPLPGLYLAVAISLAAANLFVIVVADRALRWSWHWSPSTLGRQLRYGLQSYFGHVSEIGLLRLDQFIVYGALGATQLGLYSVAALCADFMAQAAQAASYVFFARISRAGERGPHLARLAVGASCLTLFAIALPIFLFADPLVTTIFGPGFEQAVAPLRILVFAGVAQGTARMAISAVRALGSPLRSSAAHAAGLLTTAPLALWLVKYGIAGVAVATLAGQLVVAVIAYIIIERQGAPGVVPADATAPTSRSPGSS